MGCCLYVSHKTPWDGLLKWPLRYMTKQTSEDALIDHYGQERIDAWKESGLDDFVADEVAVWCGTTPGNVWPGFYEAADYYNEVTE